jgi:xylulokinase
MSYLGIDVGTSRTKAVAYDQAFRPLCRTSASYGRVCPRPGWYELDPAELGGAIRRVILDCSRQSGGDPIRWLSFSVFGGGVSALDARMRPLLNIISTTDKRAQPQAEDWCRRFGRQRTYRITGTTTHPSLMLPKILWIDAHLEHPDRLDRFVTAAEWVQASLGVRPKMDLATASTTMLLDITRRQWSDEILETARIPAGRLPQLIAPGRVVDSLPSRVCDELGLARGCALVAGGHDQQVCAFGAGLLGAGEATDSLGTVECITTLFDQPMLRTELLENNFSNLLHVHGGGVATLAYNFSAGDLFQWMRTTLSFDPPTFEAMFHRLPEQPSRVLVLPHFAGSGTPHLDARSKGVFAGLTLQTTAAEILRGAVDSMNYEMRQNLEVWRRNQIALDRLRAYGQGASSDALLQIKADILELEVQRLNVLETGCLGAALLAAQGADPDFPVAEVLGQMVTVERTFSPRSEFAEEHQRAYAVYQQLYPQTREMLHRI